MKLRIASLTILCIALTATAFGQLYQEGPIDGMDNAFFTTGPNLPNFLGSVQDISNGFVASGSGSVGNYEFGLWVFAGVSPTTGSFSLGVGAFTSDLEQVDWTCGVGGTTCNKIISGNPLGYDVYDITVQAGSVASLTAGNTYWFTVSNTNDASSSGSTAWDIPDGGSGGPATCNFRQSGTNFGNCGLGGESFTISSQQITCWVGKNAPGCDPSGTPEPSSVILFGSGVLGMAGMLLRKLLK